MDGIIERPKQPEHQFRTIHQFRDYHGVCCDLCSVEISCLAGREGTKSHRSSFAMHESGKRHKVAYSEYLEEWQCYRRDVEIYSRFAVAGQRALWSEQKWLAASKSLATFHGRRNLKVPSSISSTANMEASIRVNSIKLLNQLTRVSDWPWCSWPSSEGESHTAEKYRCLMSDVQILSSGRPALGLKNFLG